MPTLTRWFLRSALLYLLAALLLGALLAGRAIWTLPAIFDGLGPAYFHLFMVGWVTHLIFGVVYWLFPIFRRNGRREGRPRGRTWLAWAVYGLLTGGLILRVIAEPLNAQYPGSGWGALLAVSAVVQWLAALGFVANTWPRIHGGPRRHRREG